MGALEPRLAAAKAALLSAALQLPCDSHPDAPVGPEAAARVVATHGAPRTFDFPPRDHLELGRLLGLFDFGAGAAIAGSGFVVLRGDGVLLELALVQWALARAAAAGFALVAPPDVARADLVEGCGFNPRSSSAVAASPAAADAAAAPLLPSQVYSVAASDLCLAGTSEVALAGLHAGALLPAATLPAAYAAVSHCFRREAAAGGARDRGLYRLHQFTKVELFAFVAPDGDGGGDGGGGGVRAAATSDAMLRRLVDLQASLMAELGLHFRVLDMPTEELGQAAYRKFDVEAWMPCRATGGSSGDGGGGGGVGAFGEVSSASNCVDYQARRLNIRYRAGQNDNRFVHTLNATACAVPRVMLALLETHQRADGSVDIPPALRPFLGGRDVLRPAAGTSPLPR